MRFSKILWDLRRSCEISTSASNLYWYSVFFLAFLCVPVVIAAFRYIMVCHAVFVQNNGWEKKVCLTYYVMLVSTTFRWCLWTSCLIQRCGRCWCPSSQSQLFPSPPGSLATHTLVAATSSALAGRKISGVFFQEELQNPSDVRKISIKFVLSFYRVI